MRQVALSDGTMALVDYEDYLDVVYAGPWHHDRKKDHVVHWKGKGKNRIREKLHRFIGAKMGLIGPIDHKDNNGLNNTRSNLREATNSQNAMNRSPRSDSKLGIKGVSWNGTSFVVKICLNGEVTYLGSYKSLETAKEVYRKASFQYHGEYGRTE